ncbi:hypothetical protein ACQ4LE_001329 [Meloidogyne hapla]|uniref:KxDL domain-containing protein n=1 Tax=Meloidogyne hapla TaxID=6305 RepID=A0A1I8BEG2_MELHA
MAGSDFDPDFFTDSERANFQTILTRLRSFEKSVAHSFRIFEERLSIIEENVNLNKNHINGTKESVSTLRNEFKVLKNSVKDALNVENLNDR